MARKKTHYAWVVLVACCALTSGLGILISSAGQWFAPVTGELGFSVTELTLYMSVCCLGFAVVSPFVGRVCSSPLGMPYVSLPRLPCHSLTPLGSGGYRVRYLAL